MPALMSAETEKMDWKQIRKALKDGGATLRAGHFGNHVFAYRAIELLIVRLHKSNLLRGFSVGIAANQSR